MVKTRIRRIINWCLYGWKVKRTARRCGKRLRVNGKSRISPNVILGNYVNFNGMSIVGNGECRIGNYFHSGTNCQIITQNHNYDAGQLIPYDRTVIKKTVVIDDCVWFGNNVTVLGNVHIGEGAVIQAGAVVVSDIPRCAIAGGNPAKVFKMRDVEHYDELKKTNRFM